MNPRRENGAVLVSPMTSDVCSGSALIGMLLHRYAAAFGMPIRTERKSPACEDRRDNPCEAKRSQDMSGGVLPEKREPATSIPHRNPSGLSIWGAREEGFARNEQGRRRSIPPTTLPAPDIEIGSRRSGSLNLEPDFHGEM